MHKVKDNKQANNHENIFHINDWNATKNASKTMKIQKLSLSLFKTQIQRKHSLLIQMRQSICNLLFIK